jgi:glycosyltransferase involved in cell wall biosynthesis
VRITFVLPGFSGYPIGGFKVVYQFAGGLVSRGHAVTVVHPQSLEPSPGARQRLRRLTWPTRMRWRGWSKIDWFPVDPRVKVRRVTDLSETSIPDADAVIATAWQTAACVARYGRSKGRRYCLVADYEHWATGTDAIREAIARAFRGPFTLVSLGPSVTDMLASFGCVPGAEVHIGPDLDAFGLDVPIERRERVVCGFPVRSEPFKATWDVLAAAFLLNQRRPDIRFRAFGWMPDPILPPFVEYLVFPPDRKLRDFYNSLSVFVLPSHHEAWPLPPLEAMACGAALVAADSAGVRGYARDGETALLVPRGRPDAMAATIERLVDDDSLRFELARAGHHDALGYTWDRAVTVMETLLQG